MAQEKKAKASSQREEVEETVQPVAEKSTVSEATEDLLDEIDGVLETNAEEFVKQYVQKGGQ